MFHTIAEIQLNTTQSLVDSVAALAPSGYFSSPLTHTGRKASAAITWSAILTVVLITTFWEHSLECPIRVVSVCLNHLRKHRRKSTNVRAWGEQI